ncbi:MAG: enoyl-CoA hydratase/isomerase family protein [Dehalococcoidia bacterium]|nr:MAG: enoyl-CoA hydratase/isomerase family protein [Dehalococcoidia bacterium]
MKHKQYKYIIYETADHIAKITLNKPEKLNAFQWLGRGEDAAEVWSAFDQAADDDDVKVIILKGSGRAFTVGHDLTKVGFLYGMGTGKQGERRPSQRIRLKYDKMGMDDNMMHVFLNPKITIAQLHGYCIGGGIYFPLICDLAVAAEDAQLGLTEQRLGFAGSGVFGITHLILHVGMKRALELLLTGKIFSGKEAAEMGLVTKAVPADKLEEETMKLAKTMALLPRDGIAIGKATRHLIYDRLGLLSDFIPAYISHTLFTNLRWEDDEYNFFKERRDKSAKDGFHGRDERYAGLV